MNTSGIVLRFSLLLNSVFSGFCGTFLILRSKALALLFGIDSPSLPAFIGISLLLYAIGLFVNGIKKRPDRKQAVLAVALDLSWVFGTTVVIFLNLVSPIGILVLTIVGLIVWLFAALQFTGLRKTYDKTGGPFLAAIVPAALFVLLAAPLLNSLKRSGDFADLRNSYPFNTEMTRHQPQIAHSILERVAEEYGLQAWRKRQTAVFTATDEWSSAASSWWPSNPQKIKMYILLGTFTSRVELLNGGSEREIWGIQSWAPYKAKEKGRLEFLLKPDRAISFYLPTLQYLVELPFRISSAQLIRYAGETTINNRTYKLVFATWGSYSANAEHDQYMIWIDNETSRIHKVHYTVRELVKDNSASSFAWMKSLAVGTVHYSDFRRIDGVLIPFEQIVTIGGPRDTGAPLEKHFFHRLRIENLGFDRVQVAELLPDTNRKEVGDRKPENLAVNR